MLFQNPALLWLMASVAVPIALHFWHQQRAKPMPWAMLRWLETPNQPPTRGLRFDNLWLLLLRCLLLIVLALLLARPTFPPKTNVPKQATHVIEPNRQVIDAYRFELEQAIKRGERLFWATDVPTPISDLGTLPETTGQLSPLLVQGVIEQVRSPQTGLHLYVRNTPVWVDAPTVSVPSAFSLHALPSSTKPPQLEPGRLLGKGQPLSVLVNFRNADERRTVRAALSALASAYGLTYQTNEQPVAQKAYGWVLTDQPVVREEPGTTYLTTAPPTRPDLLRVTYLTGPLTTANAAVANGQLPELLGAAFIKGRGLLAGDLPLSQRAFAGLFMPDGNVPDRALAVAASTVYPRNGLQNGLLVLFLTLLLAERWIAGRRGV